MGRARPETEPPSKSRAATPRRSGLTFSAGAAERGRLVRLGCGSAILRSDKRPSREERVRSEEFPPGTRPAGAEGTALNRKRRRPAWKGRHPREDSPHSMRAASACDLAFFLCLL